MTTTKQTIRNDLRRARRACERKVAHHATDDAQAHADALNTKAHRPGEPRWRPYRCLWEPTHWHVGRAGRRAHLVELRAQRYDRWVDEVRAHLHGAVR